MIEYKPMGIIKEIVGSWVNRWKVKRLHKQAIKDFAKQGIIMSYKEFHNKKEMLEDDRRSIHEAVKSELERHPEREHELKNELIRANNQINSRMNNL